MSALQDEIRAAVRAELERERAWLEERLANLASKATPAPERLLSVAEAAAEAHRCADTVRRAIAAGLLRATRPTEGGPWLIAPVDLRAWLESPRPSPCQSGAVDLERAAEEAARRARGR